MSQKAINTSIFKYLLNTIIFPFYAEGFKSTVLLVLTPVLKKDQLFTQFVISSSTIFSITVIRFSILDNTTPIFYNLIMFLPQLAFTDLSA